MATLARGIELIPESSRNCGPLTPLLRDFEPFEDYDLIHIEASKGDPFSQGCALLVPELDDKRICPRTWFRIYLRLREQHPDAASSKYLFAMENGRPLARQQFIGELNRVCHRLKLDASLFSMHSFRIGGATELFRRGVSREIIKILGRWHGLTYEVYIRPSAQDCTQQMRRALSQAVLPERANAVFEFSDPQRA